MRRPQRQVTRRATIQGDVDWRRATLRLMDAESRAPDLWHDGRPALGGAVPGDFSQRQGQLFQSPTFFDVVARVFLSRFSFLFFS